jgi:hypothetical protein
MIMVPTENRQVAKGYWFLQTGLANKNKQKQLIIKIRILVNLIPSGKTTQHTLQLTQKQQVKTKQHFSLKIILSDYAPVIRTISFCYPAIHQRYNRW